MIQMLSIYNRLMTVPEQLMALLAAINKRCVLIPGKWLA